MSATASHFRSLLLVCAASLGLCGAHAGECVAARDDGLVLSASSHCVAQMRANPQMRRSMVRAFDPRAAAAPQPAAEAQRAERAATSRHGNSLAHPLARLSQLQAQSRYLDSLSRGPSYYGQAGTTP